MPIEQGSIKAGGLLGSVQVKNSSGTTIDPATTWGLNLPVFDYISIAYPTTVQEVYTYKSGGSGGTTVATVTVNYVDATKEFISNLTKS